jgi:radical SAM superfamily enzyme YgiQ (UPF0313 family)
MGRAPLLRFRLPDDRKATLLLGDTSTVLSVEDTLVSSWDLAGRPYALVRDDGTYRRGLDGHLLRKREAIAGSPRLRERLSGREGEPVIEVSRAEAALALESLTGERPLASAIPAARGQHRSGVDGEESAVEEALRRLRVVVSMDTSALAADAGRFAEVVGRVGILPPDQYLSLVVRVTEGCSWNACTFCDLYDGIPFRSKEPKELRAHIAALRDYFGESIRLRHSVFLGDANALCLGHEALAPIFELLSTELAGRPFYSFVDAWTGRRKGVAQWRVYAEQGLKRVYVGLETGDPDLLAWLGKPGAPVGAVDLVGSLHEAGVAVGVIVLLGAGGLRYADAHTSRTAEVLEAMQLEENDLLYFSELVVVDGLEYGRRVKGAADLQPLSPEDCAAQRRTILDLLRITEHAAKARTATYDIREFVY